jgi:hypothetical protein
MVELQWPFGVAHMFDARPHPRQRARLDLVPPDAELVPARRRCTAALRTGAAVIAAATAGSSPWSTDWSQK